MTEQERTQEREHRTYLRKGSEIYFLRDKLRAPGWRDSCFAGIVFDKIDMGKSHGFVCLGYPFQLGERINNLTLRSDEPIEEVRIVVPYMEGQRDTIQVVGEPKPALGVSYGDDGRAFFTAVGPGPRGRGYDFSIDLGKETHEELNRIRQGLKL